MSKEEESKTWPSLDKFPVLNVQINSLTREEMEEHEEFYKSMYYSECVRINVKAQYEVIKKISKKLLHYPSGRYFAKEKGASFQTFTDVLDSSVDVIDFLSGIFISDTEKGLRYLFLKKLETFLGVFKVWKECYTNYFMARTSSDKSTSFIITVNQREFDFLIDKVFLTFLDVISALGIVQEKKLMSIIKKRQQNKLDKRRSSSSCDNIDVKKMIDEVQMIRKRTTEVQDAFSKLDFAEKLLLNK